MTAVPLRVEEDADDLAAAAEERVAEALLEAVDTSGRATLALAGGSTPRLLYRRLARRPDLPWAEVDLVLGDERGVPPDHPDSNARAVRDALLRGPAAAAAFHPVPTTGGPEPAARRQHALLERLAGAPPRLDLILLGMGADGHTASLFPGSPSLTERDRWAAPTAGPSPGTWRVTITFPVLEAARRILVLVAGAGKRRAVERALAGEATVDEMPVLGARPRHGELLWLLDRAAAGPDRSSTARSSSWSS